MSSSKTSDLKTFRALSFDIFGTLIDDETGTYNALVSSPLYQALPSSHPLRASKAALLTHFYKIEHAQQARHPGERHLPPTYKQLSADLTPGRDPAAVEAEALEFAASPAHWPAFPDTVAAMQVLAKHYKLIPLTNMDNATFAAVRAGPLAGVHFDAVYTAEDVGSFKPDLRNFDYLFAHLESEFGIGKAETLHVAHSLSGDHVPANKYGLRNCYVARNPVADHGGEKGAQYEWKVATLGELAALVEQAWNEG